MKSLIILLLAITFLSGCASNKKLNNVKETCQTIHGQFTKAVDCLELKFININPKKYQEYEKTHNLVLRALADQVYENKINNVQAWLVYDDIILSFSKAKNKQEYLLSVLSKYS
mgnify:FL=1